MKTTVLPYFSIKEKLLLELKKWVKNILQYTSIKDKKPFVLN